jgi:dihydrofolate reductase
MSIIGIAAVDRKLAIGKDGRIPWHYSSDMKFFREQTVGHACVMGHKTWLSLRKPLSARLNLVLSRSAEIPPTDGVVLLRNRESVISLYKYLSCDMFVIGGEQVYRAFLSDIDKWLVTHVALEVEGADRFMPSDFLDGFTEMESRELEEGVRATSYNKEGIHKDVQD